MDALESHGWWPFAERYLESELKKAKNFKEAKRIMAMEGHIKAIAPFIDELLKLRTPEYESEILADTESKFYKEFYRSPKMSIKSTGDTTGEFSHVDFYL